MSIEEAAAAMGVEEAVVAEFCARVTEALDGVSSADAERAMVLLAESYQRSSMGRDEGPGMTVDELLADIDDVLIESGAAVERAARRTTT